MELSDASKKHIQITFDRWKKAYRTVFRQKGMTPDMLENPAVRRAIDTTAELLTEAARPALQSDAMPPEMQRSLREDIFVFSGFKTYHTLREASALLTSPEGKIKPFNAFLRDVRKIHERYNENYLEAEYLFATQSARMAARWQEDSRDADRYDLQYRTAGDDKVRIDHRALEGITLPAEDKFWEEYYPPNGWRCRCSVVKVQRDKYTRTDSDRACSAGREATEGKLGIFRFNPGRQQVIFPPQHPYYGRKGYGHCIIDDSGALSANVADNEVCRVYRTLIGQNKLQYDREGYATVPTQRGKVRIHRDVKKNERDNNLMTAGYLAEKSGYSIDLLPANKADNKKSADARNHTMDRDEEYKRVTKQTLNAVDMALKEGREQANHIVLWVDEDMPEQLIRAAVNNRFNRHKDLKEVRVIWNAKREITLTQKE